MSASQSETLAKLLFNWFSIIDKFCIIAIIVSAQLHLHLYNETLDWKSSTYKIGWYSQKKIMVQILIFVLNQGSFTWLVKRQKELENLLSIFTVKARLEWKNLTHVVVSSQKLITFIFCHIMLWGIVSNAFWRSVNIIPFIKPLPNPHFFV